MSGAIVVSSNQTIYIHANRPPKSPGVECCARWQDKTDDRECEQKEQTIIIGSADQITIVPSPNRQVYRHLQLICIKNGTSQKFVATLYLGNKGSIINFRSQDATLQSVSLAPGQKLSWTPQLGWKTEDVNYPPPPRPSLLIWFLVVIFVALLIAISAEWLSFVSLPRCADLPSWNSNAPCRR